MSVVLDICFIVPAMFLCILYVIQPFGCNTNERWLLSLYYTVWAGYYIITTSLF